jgi:PPK2 family polyphosphate:nucleotide phosphotransferase
VARSPICRTAVAVVFACVRLSHKVIDELMVHPGKPAALSRRSTSATRADWLGPIGRSSPKDIAEHDLEGFKKDLESAQELLYADDTWALLVVFQALDAGGKDGTIKHVMSGVNPEGCEVFSFKEPSSEELRHDFLWRCAKALPERGRIGIFNRSYYEEVLVVRVHPELLASQHLPSGSEAGSRLWQGRYEDITAFEHHLQRNGTRVVKFFLHISKEEQRRRLLARLDDPAKQWKFSSADLAERSHFDEYQQAYEEALSATSTSWAPWYVIPADEKSVTHALVGGVLLNAIDALDLHVPSIGEDQARELKNARKALAAD